MTNGSETRVITPSPPIPKERNETFYGAAGANPTKVMLYIAEREARGITLPIEQIVVNTVKGRHKEPEHLARTRLAQFRPLNWTMAGSFSNRSRSFIT